MCSFILMKMLNNGLMTNFVVVHAIWVILVAEVYVLSFMLSYQTESCLFWYVRTTQVFVIVRTTLGLISFSARLVDKEFRAALKAVFWRKPPSREIVLQNSHFFAVDDTNSGDPKPKFTLFEYIHLKVSSRQFILDSLISVSFNLAKKSIFPSEGVEL
jgi:hypothetical protein